MFKQICQHFKIYPQTDCFASRLNNQVAIYASFGPDPFCSYVDAFTMDWSHFETIYCFPPFNLLCRTLAKIRRDKATALVVCPEWPTQPFFSTMLNMLIKSPCRLLGNMNDILTLPWNSNIHHPNSKNLKLLSVMLSGTDTSVKAFQQTLPTCSSKATTYLQENPIQQPSKFGTYTASHGILIHCSQLIVT